MRILIALATLLCMFSCQGSKTLQSVDTLNRHIIVDDKPYFIKGVCYHPVPKGESLRNFKNLAEDLVLMTEAGVNTIRFYQPVDDVTVLDAIHRAGIKVIIGFGYNQKGYFDVLSGSFIDYIEKYKNHPAILLWEFGNEYNFHPEWFKDDIRNWYMALNDAAIKAKKVDPSHPTTTAHGELPDSVCLSLCPDVDVWGMNVYRWDTPESIFKQWHTISEKPMYLSEAGADSYMSNDNMGYTPGINELAQADATENILGDIYANPDICSGVTLFAFVDEWWKSGGLDTQSDGGFAPAGGGVPYDGVANEEYWGLVTIDRIPKKAYLVMKDFFINK